ncbi:MAG TPA: pilus assembly PilX N-terminal domain-containing protein [Blastocatellia bacterium]|nr:pilus assembly PilX N-terminal domain-containing protein [Blastocatellia bacterium]
MSTERCENQIDRGAGRPDQRGSATLTAVLILGLLAVFTAATLSRVTTESLVMGNDYSNTQAFYAAQASLELMSRSFNKVFDVQIRPSPADITRIQNTVPSSTDPLSPLNTFRFAQTITATGTVDAHPIDDGPFSGLISSRTPWQLQTVATYANGAQVQLTRTFYNHQIPIFQFGIFYNDDMEIHPGPLFDFGGRVHSNGHLFMMSGNTLRFRSRVTAAGEIVRDTSRMGGRANPATGGWQWGTPGATTWTGGQVWVANSSGVFQEVVRGSVVQAAGTQATDPDMPNWAVNPTWAADQLPFSGNLLSKVQQLRLPLQIGTNDDPIEMVKRSTAGESGVLRDSRYYNKPGIRVSLSDSQGRLPGGVGGIRLDGAGDGLGGDSGSRAFPGDGTFGYEPRTMNAGAYVPKRINGARLYKGANSAGAATVNRQTWIKVEIITLDPDTLVPIATDKTEDFLSLGMTYKNPAGLNLGDDRAILNMQRYEMLGPPLKVLPGNVQNTNQAQADAQFTQLPDARTVGNLPVYSYYNNAPTVPAITINFVATSKRVQDATTPFAWKWKATDRAVDVKEGTAQDASATTLATTALSSFEQPFTAAGVIDYRVVPFPIEIYNPREGLYNEDLPAGDAGTPGSAAALSWWYLYSGTGAIPGTATGTNSKVPVVGVMSVIDIDMGHLDTFLSGAYNGQFLGGLLSTAVPDNGGAGCILYVSDRRGDRDNDGEYDMEDIYGPLNGPNDGVLQAGEDVNKSGGLNTDFADDNAGVYSAGTNVGGEAARYNVGIETDVAAVADHKYFRRAVRVINATSDKLTGYGTLNRGYSIASENGLYTLGHFNCGNSADAANTGIWVVGTPSQATDYRGNEVVGAASKEVPASLVADAITILSREWNDAKSFRNPFVKGQRAVDAAGETGVRAALLMGDSKSSLRVAGTPNGGGGDADLAGGVHNFPRFLEAWGTRFNYCGSLINLFNSRQHDGAHKGGAVYSPPTRNWVFNTAFLDVNRLPPGTPFFQYIQMTGFRQTQRQIT